MLIIMPEANNNILSDQILRKIDIKADYENNNFRTSEGIQKMIKRNDLSYIQLVKVTPEVNNSEVNHEVWHKRLLHIAPSTMKKMNLPSKSYKHVCSGCIGAKSRHEPASKLIPKLKDTPSKPNQIFGLDLLVPSQNKCAGITGIVATMVLIDCFTRYTYAIQVQSKKKEHLLMKLELLLQMHKLTPDKIIADQ